MKDFVHMLSGSEPGVRGHVTPLPPYRPHQPLVTLGHEPPPVQILTHETCGDTLRLSVTYPDNCPLADDLAIQGTT